MFYLCQVIEVEQQYDNICNINSICNVTITLNDDMKQPVYMYYKLTNYYQNHRRYVQSRNDAQLQGQTVSNSDVSVCCIERLLNEILIVLTGLLSC